jgi:hypothetical protein
MEQIGEETELDSRITVTRAQRDKIVKESMGILYKSAHSMSGINKTDIDDIISISMQRFFLHYDRKFRMNSDKSIEQEKKDYKNHFLFLTIQYFRKASNSVSKFRNNCIDNSDEFDTFENMDIADISDVNFINKFNNSEYDNNIQNDEFVQKALKLMEEVQKASFGEKTTAKIIEFVQKVIDGESPVWTHYFRCNRYNSKVKTKFKLIYNSVFGH